MLREESNKDLNKFGSFIHCAWLAADSIHYSPCHRYCILMTSSVMTSMLRIRKHRYVRSARDSCLVVMLSPCFQIQSKWLFWMSKKVRRASSHTNLESLQCKVSASRIQYTDSTSLRNALNDNPRDGTRLRIMYGRQSTYTSQ